MGLGTDHVLNIAASYTGSQVSGPGLRSIVWVQGCPFSCHGCVSPQWIPIKPANLVSITELLHELLADPRVEGFTFSGGEPFLQASALAFLIRMAREIRDLSLICYTGYTRSVLVQHPPNTGTHDLLSQVDVLIDGPYMQDFNDNRGLRGSSNQNIHHLTDRLLGYDFESQQRNTEVVIRDGEILIVGVPPKNFIRKINREISNTRINLRGLYDKPHVTTTPIYSEG